MIEKIPAVSEERRFLPMSSGNGGAISPTGWEYAVVSVAIEVVEADYIPVPEVVGDGLNGTVYLGVDFAQGVAKGLYTVWISRMISGKLLERRAATVERN